jgi:hypothetical protein
MAKQLDSQAANYGTEVSMRLCKWKACGRVLSNLGHYLLSFKQVDVVMPSLPTQTNPFFAAGSKTVSGAAERTGEYTFASREENGRAIRESCALSPILHVRFGTHTPIVIFLRKWSKTLVMSLKLKTFLSCTDA